MKKIYISIFVIFLFYTCIFSLQVQTEEQKKLNFMVGEWKSMSVDQKTGEKLAGKSSIKWIMNGKWLLWKFSMKLKQEELEVITLINYHTEKKQYAFYSFNPIDNDPVPHFGHWLNGNTLRIETDYQGIEVRVDFKIIQKREFCQEHSRLNPSGERIITSKTYYSRVD